MSENKIECRCECCGLGLDENCETCKRRELEDFQEQFCVEGNALHKDKQVKLSCTERYYLRRGLELYIEYIQNANQHADEKYYDALRKITEKLK